MTNIKLTDDDARQLVADARSGTLGTLTPDGAPHLVPFCFALDGWTVLSAIDHKPKSTMALRRLENIRTRPATSVLVDYFDEDWSTLWWVRGDGLARVIEGGTEREEAVDLLVEKYKQYQMVRPAGPVVAIEVTQWRSWTGARLELDD